MPEFRFHHLERRRLEDATPELVEGLVEEGFRVVLQATSAEEVDAWNERLWTYSDESFLPHGSARDGEPEAQTVYLTDGPETPNAARARVLLSGADVGPALRSDCVRVLVVFDGRDEEARALARAQWAEVKAAGQALSYWREAENGGWEKAR